MHIPGASLLIAVSRGNNVRLNFFVSRIRRIIRRHHAFVESAPRPGLSLASLFFSHLAWWSMSVPDQDHNTTHMRRMMRVDKAGKADRGHASSVAAAPLSRGGLLLRQCYGAPTTRTHVPMAPQELSPPIPRMIAPCLFIVS